VHSCCLRKTASGHVHAFKPCSWYAEALLVLYGVLLNMCSVHLTSAAKAAAGQTPMPEQRVSGLALMRSH
jgi:hypothetical protein